VLIHVVDISHPNFEDHIRAVNETLKDINALDKPTITVFNKIDAYKPAIEFDENGEEIKVTLEDFKNSWMSKYADPAIFLSATEKTNIDEFRKDRKSTRLNSSHVKISYAVFCLKKKK